MPKIILNGLGVLVPNELLDYQTVCLLANVPESTYPSVAYHVRDGASGTLHVQSKPIKLVEGMIINCIDTGSA